MSLAAAIVLTTCIAIDGDTLRCDGERCRLLAIDAPEMGRCPRGRECVPGDPRASRAHLASAIRGRRITFRQVTRDRYGRAVGLVAADGRDLSCEQLAAGHATYVRRYDNGGHVRARCGRHAR